VWQASAIVWQGSATLWQTLATYEIRDINGRFIYVHTIAEQTAFEEVVKRITA